MIVLKRRKKRKRRVKRKRRRARRSRKRNKPRVKVHPVALQKTAAAAIRRRRNVLERKPKIKPKKREILPATAAPRDSVMSTNIHTVYQNSALQHAMSGRKLADHQRTEPDGTAGRREREVKRNAGAERKEKINEMKEGEIIETRAEREREINKSRAEREGEINEKEAGALRDGEMRNTERMRDTQVPAGREGGRKWTEVEREKELVEV